MLKQQVFVPTVTPVHAAAALEGIATNSLALSSHLELSAELQQLQGLKAASRLMPWRLVSDRVALGGLVEKKILCARWHFG